MLGRGRGLDPFQPSYARTPPGAFRGAGQGLGDSRAVSAGVASSSLPSILSTRAPPPPAVLGALPCLSPAWLPQTATTVQNKIKIER